MKLQIIGSILVTSIALLAPALLPSLSHRPGSNNIYYDSVVRLEVDWAIIQRSPTGAERPNVKPQDPLHGTAFIISEDGHAISAAHVLYGWNVTRDRSYSQDDVKHNSIKVHRDNSFRPDHPRQVQVLSKGDAGAVTHERDVILLRIEGGGPWRPLCFSDIAPEKGASLLALGYNARRTSISDTRGYLKNLNGDQGNWETDLSIEPGDSGGPVLDSHGLVVGIARAGQGGTQVKSIIPYQRFKVIVDGHASKKCDWPGVVRHSFAIAFAEPFIPRFAMANPIAAVATAISLTFLVIFIPSLLVSPALMRLGITRQKPRPILVIGSVLVDIIAKVANSDRKRDRIGEVNGFAVGGCAYNIFFTIKSLGVPVRLFTGINSGSPFRKKIIRKLKEVGGRDFELKLIDNAPEALFVAQRFGPHIIQAVSSTSIDKYEFPESWLKSNIGYASVVVIDLSLTALQIDSIISHVNTSNAELICNGTSDDRIVRLKDLKNGRVNSLVCSEDEFTALTGLNWGAASKMTPSEVCRLAFCTRLVVTLGEKGFAMFDPLSDDDIPKHYPAGTDQSAIKSTMGAGDALTACFAVARFQDRTRGMKFSVDTFYGTVRKELPAILGVNYSTPNAEK